MYENVFDNEFMEVRGALLSTSNNNWAAGTTMGGAEVDHMVDRMIEDALNRGVDLLPLLNKRSVDQLGPIWTVRTDLGSTNKSAFYSEGGTGTDYPSSKVQLYEPAKQFRSDYGVTGLMAAVGGFDVLADELKDAIDSHAIGLERSIICGSVTSAYGFASSFPGLLQLMGSYVYNGDTTTVHGIARASGKTYLDVAYVDANASNLALSHLDSAITASNKAGAKGDRRIFFCSEERVDEISQLLQTQQRFTGTLDLEGGFTVQTYKRIPIVGSRYMDANGLNHKRLMHSSRLCLHWTMSPNPLEAAC